VIEVAVVVLVVPIIGVDKVFALELASIGVEAEDGLGGGVVLILLMPMATKFDQRKKIKKPAKHKRNQKNNLAKNFLLPNFNLIANNNLNI
jgi:hypothetical protein